MIRKSLGWETEEVPLDQSLIDLRNSLIMFYLPLCGFLFPSLPHFPLYLSQQLKDIEKVYAFDIG